MQNILVDNVHSLRKQVPHSPDAEKAIIGLALSGAGALAEIINDVKDEYFFIDDHRLIFQHIKAIYESRNPVDIISVMDRLRSDKDASRGNLGPGFLVELLENAPIAQSPEYYSQILRRDFYLRSTINTSQGLIRDAQLHSGSAEAFLEQAEQAIFQIARGLAGGKIHSLTEVMNSTIQKIEDVVNRKGEMTGVPSGFSELDTVTGGFQKGHLILLAARPGMGKTALALNMLLNALLANKSVLMFSLEMTREEIMQRMLSSLGRINAQGFKTGNLSDDELDRLMGACRRLAPFDSKFGLDDSARLNLSEFRSRCRRFRETNGLDLIIVDYVQLMRPVPGQRFDSHTLAIASISQGMKEIAKEFEVPVIALAQLNRDLEKRASQRPKASDLKDSGSLEADADMVLLIYRDDVVNPNSQDTGIAELIVGKNRHGPMPTIRLAYFSNFLLFSNLVESPR